MDDALPAVAELALDKAKHFVKIHNVPAKSWFHEKATGFLRGWHVTVCAAALIAVFVLITNFVLLIWGSQQATLPSSNASNILYEGSCSRMQQISTWSHFAINLLSTLLLAASNSACQILSAPTREEIDAAHSRGKWVDIGVPSFRNLRFICGKRVIIILFLASSSVPLHLIYNSVIFPTTSSTDPVAVLAYPSFIDEPPLSWATARQREVSPHSYTEQYQIHFWYQSIKRFQSKARAHYHDRRSTLVSLKPQTCINELLQPYTNNYTNFLVVAGNEPVNNTSGGLILWNVRPTRLYGISSYEARGMHWICRSMDHEKFVCDVRATPASKDRKKSLATSTNGTASTTASLHQSVEIKHCLVENVAPKCTISFSKQILAAVIICNIVKLTCFLLVLRWSRNEPLGNILQASNLGLHHTEKKKIVTLGDCIRSFLLKPDLFTHSLGPLSVMDVRNGGSLRQRQGWRQRPDVWEAKKRQWFASAGWRRWLMLLSCYIIASGLLLSIILPIGLHPSNFVKVKIPGMGLFGYTYLSSLISGSLSKMVVLVNVPQLILSFLYLFSNSMLTNSLQSAEFCEFAKRPKPLRTASVSGGRHSTYWLQIPYQYAIPNLLLWTGLHWLWSQLMFLARITTYGYKADEELVPIVTDSVSAVGYSALAMQIGPPMVAIPFFMLVGLGFRRFPAGVPVVAACSAAIAAACHSPEAEEKDIAHLPLQYGVLQDKSIESEEEVMQQVGLSAGKVEPLEKDAIYR